MGKKVRKKRRIQQHKVSIIAISCVTVLLAGVVGIASLSLQEKNRDYKAKEAELKEALNDEQTRSEEIDELEEYVGTEEYVRDIAKEKLGLIGSDEIIFKPEQ